LRLEAVASVLNGTRALLVKKTHYTPRPVFTLLPLYLKMKRMEGVYMDMGRIRRGREEEEGVRI
jgi:hypothetical protein